MYIAIVTLYPTLHTGAIVVAQLPNKAVMYYAHIPQPTAADAGVSLVNHYTTTDILNSRTQGFVDCLHLQAVGEDLQVKMS